MAAERVSTDLLISSFQRLPVPVNPKRDAIGKGPTDESLEPLRPDLPTVGDSHRSPWHSPVLTAGAGRRRCGTCTTTAAVAALAERFEMPPADTQCEKKHGIFSPAVRRDTRTGTLLCAACFEKVLADVKGGIADSPPGSIIGSRTGRNIFDIRSLPRPGRSSTRL